jgi:hypothetical protein
LDIILKASTVKDAMKLNLDNLPEKDFFTIDEIAKRWECDLGIVKDYIFEQKKLRLAIKTDQYLNFKRIRNKEMRQNYTVLIKIIDEVLPESVFSFVDKAYVRYAYIRGTEKEEEFGKELGHLSISEVSKDSEITKYLNEINQSSPNASKISIAQLPKYLYQENEHVFEEDRFKSKDCNFDARYNLYSITVRDLENNCYLLYQPEINIIHITHPFLFDIITKEERDRFEKEFEITEDTKSVQQQVSKKTENLQLELMQLFAGMMLKKGLSNNPHTDVEQIIKRLAAANKKLPCSKETLAKYLKENRS